MRDISNFGNNLRDEIIEYRLEHEAGYSIKRKFVDEGDETSVCFSLYSRSGDLLSESESVPFDPAGQRVIDDVKLIRGSDEGRDAEYEIKVTFKGSRDPIYCPVDDILTTLRKELSNKISMIADAESEEADPTPVFVADVKDKKVTVYDLDVKNSININKALEVTGDIKANGISITADGQLKIGDTILNEATLIKLVALVENTTETESK